MNKIWRLMGLFCTAMVLSSCGLFGDKEDKELGPKELVKFDSKIDVKRLWNNKLGGDAEFLLVGLRPTGDGNRIYAASLDGKVAAYDPETGKQRWKTDLQEQLSAGPAVGTGSVVVATRDGDVVLLDADSGSEQWRTDIGGETLSNPIIENDSVVVQTIDSRLIALARFDGRQRWEVEQTTPVLTMRGTSSPVLVGSTVVAGFDNGKLLVVDLDSGDIVWDSMLALATGRSDLDRLSDIDGAIAVIGQDIYAAGYHGQIAAIAAESGQVLWSREISTHSGVAADWNSIYTAREDGEIIALSRQGGVEVWRNDNLLRRDPTLPVPFQTTVVVGDLEGYLHFFSTIDGIPLARVRLGKQAITSDPFVIGNRLYVQSDGGSIAAYEITQGRPTRNAPDIADEADES